MNNLRTASAAAPAPANLANLAHVNNAPTGDAYSNQELFNALIQLNWMGDDQFIFQIEDDQSSKVEIGDCVYTIRKTNIPLLIQQVKNHWAKWKASLDFTAISVTAEQLCKMGWDGDSLDEFLFQGNDNSNSIVLYKDIYFQNSDLLCIQQLVLLKLTERMGLQGLVQAGSSSSNEQYVYYPVGRLRSSQEMIRDSILSLALELIKNGWNGEDEQIFQETNDNNVFSVLIGGQAHLVAENDIPIVKKTVKEYLAYYHRAKSQFESQQNEPNQGIPASEEDDDPIASEPVYSELSLMEMFDPDRAAQALYDAGWRGQDDSVFIDDEDFFLLESHKLAFDKKDLPLIRKKVCELCAKKESPATSHQDIPFAFAGAKVEVPTTAMQSASSTSAPKQSNPAPENIVRKRTADSIVRRASNALETNSEELRRQLNGFKNPYLLLHLAKKLESFITNLNDAELKELLMACLEIEAMARDSWDVKRVDKWFLFFNDNRFPMEIKRQFLSYITSLIQTHCPEGRIQPQSNDAIKTSVRPFVQLLRTAADAHTVEIGNWKYFTMLLQIPGFMSLSISNFKKLIDIINQGNPDLLRDFVDLLHNSRALDIRQLERELAGLCTDDEDDDELSLKDFLGEIVQTKPAISRGLFRAWNHPPEFFHNRVLQIREPGGVSYVGTVLRCKKENGNKVMTLSCYDQAEIRIDRTSTSGCHVVLTQRCPLPKLWEAVYGGSLSNGDPIYVVQSQDPDRIPAISLGGYRLLNIQKRSGKRTGVTFIQVTLIDEKTNEERYTLLMTRGKENNSVRVIRRESHGRKFRPVDLTMEEFNRSFKLLKTQDIILMGITEDNAENALQLMDGTNEELNRLRVLEDIKEELITIRHDLMREENEELLAALLSNLVENKLQNIAFSVLDQFPTDIGERVRRLNKKYYDELKTDRTVGNILRQVVLEANYANHIDKESNVSMARTLQLLSGAFTHVDAMDKKDLVLFMGNTGAGKSTSINYLLGTKLRRSCNQVGEEVVRVVMSEEAEQELPVEAAQELPVIGQSIGMSETLYAQGFHVRNVASNNNNVLFTDCAGVDDTRGDGHILCSLLSLDEAVRVAKSILSIVVVIPAATFLSDRGNGIIDLIKSLQERFPTILAPENRKSVFFLVTKRNQVNDEVLVNIKNGERFRQHIQELEGQIATLKQSGVEEDSLEVEAIRVKLEIWTALLDMLGDPRDVSTSQFDYIDIENSHRRNLLVSKYVQRPSPINKKEYSRALKGVDLQQKFTECVELSAHTWVDLIFEEYLSVLPMKIESVEKKVLTTERDLGSLQEEKAGQEQRIEVLKGQNSTLQTEIDRLKSEFDPASLELAPDGAAQSAENLDPSLRQTAGNKWGTLRTERKNLEEILGKVKKYESGIPRSAARCTEFELEIKRAKTDLRKIKTKIEQLREGETTQCLFKDVYKADKITKLTYWTHGARKKAHARGEVAANDRNKHKVIWINPRTWKGKISDIAIIERGYRLVPKDPGQRMEFINAELEAGSRMAVGGFVASVEGVSCRIDLKCNPCKDDTKVAYGYSMNFRGDGTIPWIKIHYTVPNHVLNRAAIINLISDKHQLEKRITSLTLDLHEETRRKKGKEKRFEFWKQEKINAESKVELLVHQGIIIELRARLRSKEEELVQNQQEIGRLTVEIGVLDESIAILQTTAKSTRKILRDLNVKLRNIAIIIINEWGSAVLLRRFAVLIEEPTAQDKKSTKGKNKFETWSTCQKFIETFDKNQQPILENIERKFGFRILSPLIDIK